MQTRIILAFILLLAITISVQLQERVTSFSGNGGKNTRPFSVNADWEIRWDAQGDIFQLYLYSSDGELVGVPANQSGSGSGSSYQPKPGTYYLQVNAIGDWDIEIVPLSAKPNKKNSAEGNRNIAGAVATFLAQSSFEILAKDEFAFREGKQVYRLGVKASDFEKQFGPPEKRFKAGGPEGYTGNCTFLQYINDGLEVLVDPKGIVKGFTFYVVSSTEYKTANIRTDSGIERGASARQIQRIHGEPYKRKEFKVAGFDWLNLFYHKDSLLLEFKFNKGIFENIGIYAGYLPYLEK